MARDLSAFLHAAAARRFEPGVWDCGFWLADWIALRTGADPAADLRGMSSEAWRAKAAFLPVTVSRVMRRAGYKRTDGPSSGDVGVLRVERQFVGGIKTGMGWVVLSTAGIVCSKRLETAVVRAWAVDA